MERIALPVRERAVEVDLPLRLKAEQLPHRRISNSKSSPAVHFWDSQISAEVVHHWDGAFAVPSGWIARGVRGLSGPPEGTPRQHRDGGFRAVGIRPVFHAKRVVSGVPARPGEGPGALELPDS